MVDYVTTGKGHRPATCAGRVESSDAGHRRARERGRDESRSDRGGSTRGCSVGRAGQPGDGRAPILPPSPRQDHPTKQAGDAATQNPAGGPEAGRAGREPSRGGSVASRSPHVYRRVAQPQPSPPPRLSLAPENSGTPTESGWKGSYQGFTSDGLSTQEGLMLQPHGAVQDTCPADRQGAWAGCIQRVWHSPPGGLWASNRRTYQMKQLHFLPKSHLPL